MGTYDEVFRASVTDPEAFWLDAASGIDWSVPPTQALDSTNPPFYRWFPDGELNVAYNALDRHVDAGRGEQAALIYDSPVTGYAAYLHLPRTARRGRRLRRGAGRAWVSSRATWWSSTCR